MIIEYIRYRVPAERHGDFTQAYQRASGRLDAAQECLSYEVAQGVEDPECFIVRIEWTSREAHEQGFRKGPHFPDFLAQVRPFIEQIEEMRHYDRTAVVSSKGSVASTTG